jgi:GxxExxY protein
MDLADQFEEEFDFGPQLNRITRDVIGAAIEVHRTLGPGHLESVYENALIIELAERGIPFEAQFPVSIYYKNHLVGTGKVDLLVGDLAIVEIKAVEALAPIHTAQLISYLKITGKRLGLLINFNVRVLKDGIKRVAN